MEELIPHKLIDIDYRILYDLGNIYKTAGDSVKFRSIAREVIPLAYQNMTSDLRSLQSPYNSYRMLEDLYVNLKEYDKALDILYRLQNLIPDDPGLKGEIENIKKLKK